MKKIRHFIAVRKGEGRPRNPYYMQVFEIMPNKSIESIGREEFSIDMSKGMESVAFSVLNNQGIVSDKEYSNNNGYYYGSKASIKITVL